MFNSAILYITQVLIAQFASPLIMLIGVNSLYNTVFTMEDVYITFDITLIALIKVVYVSYARLSHKI